MYVMDRMKEDKDPDAVFKNFKTSKYFQVPYSMLDTCLINFSFSRAESEHGGV